jgi:hypothetical protein
MARRPIYRLDITFSYSSAKTKGTKVKRDIKRIFATTTDIAELNSCATTKGRLAATLNKKAADLTITIQKVEVEGQYGETTDRF